MSDAPNPANRIFRGPVPAAVAQFNELMADLAVSLKKARSNLADNELACAQKEAELAELERAERGNAAILQQLERDYQSRAADLAKASADCVSLVARERELDQLIRKHPRATAAAYDGEDGEVLRTALIRLKLLESGRRLPSPVARFTGVVGKSRVYHVILSNGDKTRLNLIAKFDPPDRARREWGKLAALHTAEHPTGIRMPENVPELETDKVIVYRAAHSDSPSGKVMELKAYLSLGKQFLDSTDNCTACLSQALGALNGFHNSAPGAFDTVKHGPRNAVWSDIFDSKMLPTGKSLRETATNAWANIKWNRKTIEVPGGRSRVLPNPVAAPVLARELGKQVGSVWQSRIHGDLNLTNFLVCLKSNFAPASVVVIDLGSTEPNRIAALDFARLESEFWLWTFRDAVAAARSRTGRKGWMAQLIAARDWLDGRNGDSKFLETATPAEAATGKFVRELRRRAYKVLGQGQELYCLEDFFRCLYFTSLASLRFQLVLKNDEHVRVMLVSAALALQTLEDLETGLYRSDPLHYQFPLTEE